MTLLSPSSKLKIMVFNENDKYLPRGNNWCKRKFLRNLGENFKQFLIPTIGRGDTFNVEVLSFTFVR